jgi:hypothetical protein
MHTEVLVMPRLFRLKVKIDLRFLKYQWLRDTGCSKVYVTEKVTIKSIPTLKIRSAGSGMNVSLSMHLSLPF